MKNVLLASTVCLMTCVGLTACAPTMMSQNANYQERVSPKMSFFVTSDGKGDGANLGGLAGADAHCEALASAVGQGGKGWRAYLSTTGEGGVDARDRIGTGPWFNAVGEVVAANLAELHGENNITGDTTLLENGDEVPWRLHDSGVGKRTYHDMFTGTQADGTGLENGEDTTCSNWTSGGEGGALLGHSNREGGGYDGKSWTNAHTSNACSEEGAANSSVGLYYCFASAP